jgi:hypothetical protein
MMKIIDFGWISIDLISLSIVPIIFSVWKIVKIFINSYRLKKFKFKLKYFSFISRCNEHDCDMISLFVKYPESVFCKTANEVVESSTGYDKYVIENSKSSMHSLCHNFVTNFKKLSKEEVIALGNEVVARLDKIIDGVNESHNTFRIPSKKDLESLNKMHAFGLLNTLSPYGGCKFDSVTCARPTALFKELFI